MRVLVLFFVALVAGCSTPRIVMKHPETGQVAQCGGSATGSMVGGVIGYHIQKSNDMECANEYLKQGFTASP